MSFQQKAYHTAANVHSKPALDHDSTLIPAGAGPSGIRARSAQRYVPSQDPCTCTSDGSLARDRSRTSAGALEQRPTPPSGLARRVGPAPEQACRRHTIDPTPIRTASVFVARRRDPYAAVRALGVRMTSWRSTTPRTVFDSARMRLPPQADCREHETHYQPE